MSSTNSTNLVFDICKFLNPAVDVSKPFYVNYAIAFSQFYTPIHKVLVGIIVAFGLISNGSLLAVLTRKKMSSATNKFLIGISIADSVVLITYSCIWIQFVQRKFFSYELSYAFATYIGPYLMYRGVSSLLTVLLALWRVSSLYFPFQSSIKLTDGNAVKGMLFCFGICQILFIPHTIGFKNISANCTINGMYQTVFYISYKSEALRKVALVISSFLTQLIPCILLAMATAAILIKLRTVKKRKAALKNSSTDEENNTQTERALLAILVLFLICELPLGTLIFFSIFNTNFNSVIVSLFHFFAMLRLLNASLNFILYCTMSSLFRTTFKEIVSSVLSELTSIADYNTMNQSPSKKLDTLELN